MKGFKGFGVLAFLGVFGGFHYLLNLDRHAPSPSVEGDQKVIQEMAVFIQKHPEMLAENRNISESKSEPRSNGMAQVDSPAPTVRDPEVFGIALNRQTIEKLSSPEGVAEVQVRMSRNPQAALNELKQAWKILDPADTERREALQELTVAFRKLQNDPDLDVSLVEEIKRVNREPDFSDARLEYVGRTLQRHLNSEGNEGRLNEQLQALGIPRVVVESPEPGRAPASTESVK
jgi:hypothetical protein